MFNRVISAIKDESNEEDEEGGWIRHTGTEEIMDQMLLSETPRKVKPTAESMDSLIDLDSQDNFESN